MKVCECLRWSNLDNVQVSYMVLYIPIHLAQNYMIYDKATWHTQHCMFWHVYN